MGRLCAAPGNTGSVPGQKSNYLASTTKGVRRANYPQSTKGMNGLPKKRNSVGWMSIGGLDRTRSVIESVRSSVQTDRAGPKSEEKPERSLPQTSSDHWFLLPIYPADGHYALVSARRSTVGDRPGIRGCWSLCLQHLRHSRPSVNDLKPGFSGNHFRT